MVQLGDVFEVPISKERKGYVQFVTTDSCELNSDVIRVFSKRYHVSDTPNLKDIVDGDIDSFYHVYLKVGVKTNVWHKIGNVPGEEGFDAPYLRSSEDYGNPDVRVSQNWFVWRTTDSSPRYVGKLSEK